MKRHEEKEPTRRRWRILTAFVVLVCGAVCAAWLGRQAGRYVRLQSDDLRPVVGPHLHLSGTTYLDVGRS